MNTDRKLTFGKYKNQTIKALLFTHIGYIMWCLDNLKWFRLNTEEQAIYDALATMIKKENLPMTFPTENLYKHVKNKSMLNSLETPFFSNGDYTSIIINEQNMPLYKSVENYLIQTEPCKDTLLSDINDVVNREIAHRQLRGITQHDMFGGWEHDDYGHTELDDEL